MTRPALAVTLGTCVLVAIGLYDVVIGVVLLASASPWVAHGPDTAWMALGASLQGAPLPELTLGLFRRMGAFSFHAGVATCVWAALGHRRPTVRSAQLITYLLTGLAFGVTDATFFPGTPYLLMKRIIGVAFTAAFVAHFVFARKTPAGQGA
jgi:hypothetical protein